MSFSGGQHHNSRLHHLQSGHRQLSGNARQVLDVHRQSGRRLQPAGVPGRPAPVPVLLGQQLPADQHNDHVGGPANLPECRRSMRVRQLQ